MNYDAGASITAQLFYRSLLASDTYRSSNAGLLSKTHWQKCKDNHYQGSSQIIESDVGRNQNRDSLCHRSFRIVIR